MIELVNEVLDHAPEMTAAERLVLVAIAEATRARGRSRDIRTADLLRRTGLAERGLRHAFARLANRGVEVRVPLGKDERGQLMYAVPGRVPTYLLPDFPVPPDCPCDRCAQGGTMVPPEGGPTSPPTNGGGPTGPAAGRTGPEAGRTGPAAGRTGPPTPSVRDGVGAQAHAPTRPASRRTVRGRTVGASQHDFVADVQTPDRCVSCGWPRPNARHRRSA